MSPQRTIRQLGIVAAAGAMLLPLAGPAHADFGAKTGHRFAYSRYHWGPITWQYTFETGKFPRQAWHQEGQGQLGQNYGMITLDSDSPGGLSATLTKHPETYGRWEVRMRDKRFPHTTGADYTVATELVPASDPDGHCGGQAIDYGSYTPDRSATAFALHALPGQVYTASRSARHPDDFWHTYAVQITRKNITWFLDGKPQVTERNPSAFSRVPYTMRLALIPPAGATAMKKTRLMVDTVRYFTLKHGKRATAHKAPAESTAPAC
jgi:hypothetical protein